MKAKAVVITIAALTALLLLIASPFLVRASIGHPAIPYMRDVHAYSCTVVSGCLIADGSSLSGYGMNPRYVQGAREECGYLIQWAFVTPVIQGKYVNYFYKCDTRIADMLGLKGGNHVERR